MSLIIDYLIVAMLATVLPSPSDPFHFYLQNYLYKHKHNRVKFELLQIFDWYILDALWYLLLLGIVLYFNIQNLPDANALTTIFTILGVGATISIIWRFIRR